MEKKSLGKLEYLNLRDLWEREDTDFTPWLAKEENISLLGETIGMKDLLVEKIEANVGPFRADILCRNLYDDTYVLIENQLEKTDHSHLGQLITYGTGLDAMALIWVVKEFQEEHRAALEWLNRITDDNYLFFGIEVELLKIDDSRPAVNFKIAAEPNNWSKSIRKSGYSEEQTRRQEFWSELLKTPDMKGSGLYGKEPTTDVYMKYRVGKPAIFMTLKVLNKIVSVGLELDRERTGEIFKKLMEKRTEIEDRCGLEFEWDEVSGTRWHRITAIKEGYLKNRSTWPELHAWMIETMNTIEQLFRPLIDEA